MTDLPTMPMEEPENRVPAKPPRPADGLPEQIGRYRVLESIGEGGMGEVYRAEQRSPIRREVAIKVIKLGMDTKLVVARFEAERQALAMMDHPHIAKVFDANVDEAGRPYFVMEYVKGKPITDYADQNHLTIRERVELFSQVCHAIQHAHHKGVIHRDLKPSNVLVSTQDGKPFAKVIDFGIAKATSQRLTEKTLYTQHEQFIGTPQYMSPEQADGSMDIDTRTDVYSLGVMLYELLTGTPPFASEELKAAAMEKIKQMIREVDPPKPSTRLSKSQQALPALAHQRRTEPKKLGGLVRGELDWIVMKALEKDRARRYDTPTSLEEDLQRFLDGRPVKAAPPSVAYRFQKAFRRNKVAYLAGTAILLALVIGLGSATAMYVRERVALSGEQQQREKAVQAEASETVLRRQAQAEELIARQHAYASDMHVAEQALAQSNLGRALDLLNRQLPQPGEKDLRGWEWRYLWQQTRSDALFTLCRKSSQIDSLAASADGRWLAIGLRHKGGVFVYDLQTRQQVAQLAPDEEGAHAAFSPTEPLLAFTSVNLEHTRANLHLWSTSTCEMVAEVPLENWRAGLAFSQDGKMLVTSTDRGHITLWRVADHTKLVSYSSDESDDGPTIAFTANADLSLAAYGTKSGQVYVINLRNGKTLWTTAASQYVVTALAFSPDGKTLVTAFGFGDAHLCLWNVATGKQIGQLQGHSSWVSSIAFWPDGKKLATSSTDQTLRIWDLASQKCLDVLRGHRQEVWQLVLLPDDKTLVSGCKDGTVCFWDSSVTHPRKARITIPDQVDQWRFAADNRSVLTDNMQGGVTRWTGADFQEKETLLGNGTPWESCFSRDGRYLASSSGAGTISVWDLSLRVLCRKFNPSDGSVIPRNFLAQGTELILSSPADNRFSEWDLKANREIQSWSRPTTDRRVFVMSSSDRLLVGIGNDGGVSLRDLPGRRSTPLSLDVLECRDAAFSFDENRFAVTSDLGYARIWDTTTWREEATLRGFLHAVGSVAFSPNGKRLATGGARSNDAVKLWDTDDWQDLFTLEGSGNKFIETAFSPDGNSLGAVSFDGILNIWQAPSWAEIHAAEKAQATMPGVQQN